MLEPFAESVTTRFNEWLMDKAKAGVTFNTDQLAWLNLIRDHIATSLSIEPDDFDYAPFSQRGGLGKAHQLFGEQLPSILDESIVDEIVVVGDDDAYRVTKELWRTEALMVGPSTGAVVHAASQIDSSDGELVVGISADSGIKYTSYFEEILGNEGRPKI